MRHSIGASSSGSGGSPAFQQPSNHPVLVFSKPGTGQHDRRTPSEPLLSQFAIVLQVPPDLLYCSLGKIPPDIKAYPASEEQILAAFQAFRQVLVIDPVSLSGEDVHPVRYPGAVGN